MTSKCLLKFNCLLVCDMIIMIITLRRRDKMRWALLEPGGCTAFRSDPSSNMLTHPAHRQLIGRSTHRLHRIEIESLQQRQLLQEHRPLQHRKEDQRDEQPCLIYLHAISLVALQPSSWRTACGKAVLSRG